MSIYMAGPSKVAINYDYSQPAEICAYSSAFNPKAAWLLTALVPFLTALCAHTGLTITGEMSYLLAAS